MGRQYLYEQCRTFARLLALAAEERAPDIATVARPLHAREGKVYVDFGQNGYGRTIAAPFSVRPLPGAPVSCPLRWSEVTARLDPGRYTLKTAVRRFAKLGDPLAAVVDAPGVDMPAALANLETLFKGSRQG
jgi:bifunctional non-homologous end joining protein LigD